MWDYDVPLRWSKSRAGSDRSDRYYLLTPYLPFQLLLIFYGITGILE